MDFLESMEYLKGLTKFGINLGLGRIQNLLSRLGNPEQKTQFIHVGGTNGKGSTSSMLSSILACTGKKVGLFTSPHIHSYTERIRVNGEEIREEEIAQLLTVMRHHLDAMVQEGIEHPTEFEVSTALALCYFAEQKVDLAIMEVGMGGEIDSTNVITPQIAIITNVAMDHMDYLGPNEEAIARVKAGIIKPGCHVITASDNPDVLRVIREVAGEKKATLWEEGKDFRANGLAYSELEQIFNCNVQNKVFEKLKISLRGKHQLVNAATAIAAAVKIGAREEAIREGLEKAQWPCRLEIMSKEPSVIIDAAHNYHGIKVLVEALNQYWPQEKMVLVLGMLADKEREKVVTEIAPMAHTVIVTKPNNPRAGEWQQVADFVRPLVQEVIVEENIAQAVDKALSSAGKEYMVCITGSIYMVSEARAHLLKIKN